MLNLKANNAEIKKIITGTNFAKVTMVLINAAVLTPLKIKKWTTQITILAPIIEMILFPLPKNLKK